MSLLDTIKGLFGGAKKADSCDKCASGEEHSHEAAAAEEPMEAPVADMQEEAPATEEAMEAPAAEEVAGEKFCEVCGINVPANHTH